MMSFLKVAGTLRRAVRPGHGTQRLADGTAERACYLDWYK